MSSSPGIDRLATLCVDDFAPRIEETFRMDEPALELSLEEADAMGSAGSAPGAGGRQAFALLFRGPAEQPLGQGTYTLDHATLGSLSLFLVPVASDGQSAHYEAVFN